MLLLQCFRSAYREISRIFRPVAGGGAGGLEPPPPPESFRLELISAREVEFCY